MPRLQALLALAGVVAGCPGVAAGGVLDDVDVRGYVDVRAILTDDERTWMSEGLGKAPLGNGDAALTGRLSEAILAVSAPLGWSTSGSVTLQYNDAQDHPVDVQEAYLRYRPVSTRPLAFEAKGGLYFPPGSLENTGVGWSSPYTLSSSAINSWLGEEFRVEGLEGTAVLRRESSEWRLGAGAFLGGDPQGALLAWRGWAIHDRELGRFEEWRLPELPFIGPGGFEEQSVLHRPFDEMDHDPGYYVHGSWQARAGHEVQVAWYDNSADPEDVDVDKGQYGWRTRYLSIGAKLEPASGTTVIAQGMTGDTIWGPPLSNGRRVTDLSFDAAFLLVSHAFDHHRLSLRYDWFRTEDRDVLQFLDDNDESGRGWTAAWIWRPGEPHRITLEVLHVASDRDQRSHLGLDVGADETTVQLSYRWLFQFLPGEGS